MYLIIWKFVINPEFENEFLQAYSPDGLWTQLFNKDKNYLGTELLKDIEPYSYLTIDRWQSSDAYEKFLNNHREAYEKLDKHCEDFTIHESKIGTFLLCE